MDCQTAHILIDERVQQLAEAGRSGPQSSLESSMPTTDGSRWAELEAHLARCRSCAAEFEELLRARNLLTELAGDAPTAEETEAMWTAIQDAVKADTPAASPTRPPDPARQARRRAVLHFAAMATSVAAVLALAAFVGHAKRESALAPVSSIGGGQGGSFEMGYTPASPRTSATRYGDENSPGEHVAASPAPKKPRPKLKRRKSEPTGPFRAFSDEVARRGDDADRNGLHDAALLERLQSRGYTGAARARARTARRGASVSAGRTTATTTEERFGEPFFHSAEHVSAGYEVQSESGGEAVSEGIVVGSKYTLRAPMEAPPLPSRNRSGGEFEGWSELVYGYQVPLGPGRTKGSPTHEAGWRFTAGDGIVDYAVPSAEAEEIAEYRREQVRTAFVNAPRALESARQQLAELEFDGSRDSEDGAYSKRALLEEQVAALESAAEWLELYEGPQPPPAPRADPNGDVPVLNAAFRDSEADGLPDSGSSDDAGRAVAEPQPEPSEPARAEQRPAPSARPKVMKTGHLGLEVASYAAAAEQAQGIVGQFDAIVADVRMEEQTGGAMLGHLTIRVAPEQFEGLYAALKQVGRIEFENVKAADVTAEYVDLEARIRGLLITEQRLAELIKSKSFMDKINSLLEVEREMNRVRTEIEQLEGQLRVMADRVARSTIHVSLREPARTVPSASLSVEVPALEPAATALGEALARLGGRLVSGKTQKRDNGALKGDYQVEVSLARFGELLDAITGLGRVEQRQIKDHEAGLATAPWAGRVKCAVALVLFEGSRQLPSGVVAIEVEGLDTSLEQLQVILAGGAGAITSNRTTRRDDGSHVAELELKVPAGGFAELVEALTPLGRVTTKRVAGEAGRIIGGAASVPCDLKLTLAEPVREVPSGHMAVEVDEFEKAREALSRLVKNKQIQVLGSASNQRTDGTWVGAFRLGIRAGDLEEVVTSLANLGRVESRQIAGIGLGDLSRVDPSALGVIELALGEKSTIRPEPRQAGDTIRAQLRDGLAGLYSSVGLILYGLVFLAPWLVLTLGLAWGFMRWRRRRVSPASQAGEAAGTE